MRIEIAKERIFLTEEETAVLQRAEEILEDMYNMSDNDALCSLLTDVEGGLDSLWETNIDFEIIPAVTTAPKAIKVNIELH